MFNKFSFTRIQKKMKIYKLDAINIYVACYVFLLKNAPTLKGFVVSNVISITLFKALFDISILNKH